MLKKEDLRVGMRVKRRELRDIYGVWVYFDSYSSSDGGRIICISESRYSEEVDRAIQGNGGRVCTFYQNPDKCNNEVVIYE